MRSLDNTFLIGVSHGNTVGNVFVTTRNTNIMVGAQCVLVNLFLPVGVMGA